MSLLETDLFGAITLLVVGVVAIVLALLLLKEYLASKKIYHLAWALSFLVLFISGVLIIFLGWDEALKNALVPPVAALIPAGLAIGLLYAVFDDKKYGFYYAIYGLVVIALITVIKLDLLELDIASMVIMAIHIISTSIHSIY